MRSQWPVRTQIRTSITEREKESSSAAVKRPQQPKEILENTTRNTKTMKALLWYVARRRLGGVSCGSYLDWVQEHQKCPSDKALVKAKVPKAWTQGSPPQTWLICQDPKIRRKGYFGYSIIGLSAERVSEVFYPFMPIWGWGRRSFKIQLSIQEESNLFQKTLFQSCHKSWTFF